MIKSKNNLEMSATSAIKAERIEGKEDSRLKLALLVIATAQLMLVLDDAIANIAWPSIQGDLGVSVFTLPWIVNAYILAFGGLLLFGGRVGDLFGSSYRRCNCDNYKAYT